MTMDKFPKIKALHQEPVRPLLVPLDRNSRPASWSTVEYKEYHHMPRVDLPKPEEPTKTFREVLRGRSTLRHFDTTKSLSTQTLSNLLFWSAGESGRFGGPNEPLRFYPSGGGRFPLELYLSFKGNEGIPRGVYHYNVKGHYLEHLLEKEGDATIRSLPNYPWIKDAPLILITTAIFERSMRKYRERGYRFVNLDAGVLLESFYLVASAFEIGCCGGGNII